MQSIHVHLDVHIFTTWIQCRKLICLLFVYGEFIFHLILMQFFSLNWLGHECLVVSWQIYSYLLWFKDKHNRKGTTAEFQNLNFLILYPIVMQFFAKWSSLWTIQNYFIFKRGIKETKIQKFHIFGRHT